MKPGEATHSLLTASPIMATAAVNVEIDEARKNVRRRRTLSLCEAIAYNIGNSTITRFDGTDHPTGLCQDRSAEPRRHDLSFDRRLYNSTTRLSRML
jgi:hypothetical protein